MFKYFHKLNLQFLMYQLQTARKDISGTWVDLIHLPISTIPEKRMWNL